MLRRAQSSLEYALLITAIVAALVAMRIYISRGIQGRLKETADSLGQQYEVGKTTSDITIESSAHVITRVTSNLVGNKMVSTTNTEIVSESERRYGSETILP